MKYTNCISICEIQIIIFDEINDNKLGPLLDRIDIHIEVMQVPFDKLSELCSAVSGVTVRYRVIKVQNIQMERFRGYYRQGKPKEYLVCSYNL